MKVLDLETKSYHDLVSIDYDNNIVVMESPKYGRTRNTIDKVRLIHDHKEDDKGKVIVKPKWFWTIPFVGWFMIPYTLFTINDCIIKSENMIDDVIMLLTGLSPILLLSFMFYLAL